MKNEMEMIIFDTEYTAWDGSKERGWNKDGEHREIIQIAAVHVAIDSDLSILSEFNVFVRPKINPVLSQYIKKLTGITQQNIDNESISFLKAIEQFSQFCGTVKNIYCWGNDEEILRENCYIHGVFLEYYFKDHNFLDICHVFKKAGIDTSLYESGSVYKSVNLTLENNPHYALHDVYSMSETLRYLLKEKRLPKAEFYHCPRSFILRK